MRTMRAVRQARWKTGIVSERDGGIDYQVARRGKSALWVCMHGVRYADCSLGLQNDNTRTYNLVIRWQTIHVTSRIHRLWAGGCKLYCVQRTIFFACIYDYPIKARSQLSFRPTIGHLTTFKHTHPNNRPCLCMSDTFPRPLPYQSRKLSIPLHSLPKQQS